MNGLDSPIESLAFIPLNLGPLFSAAVNNIWAWVAVITAAVSFWRIRNTSSLKTTSSDDIFLSPLPSTHPTPTTFKTTPFVRQTGVDVEERENEDENGEEEEEEEVVVLTRGNSKKFFTVFYEEREDDQGKNDDDEMDGGDEEEEEEEVEEKNEWVVIKRWGSSSESTVEIRGGDFGWYSYQNRKVIDGSVVRLWGEEGESGCGGSPRSCRKRSSSKNFAYPSRKLSTSNSFS